MRATMNYTEKQTYQQQLLELPKTGFLRARQIHPLLGIGLSTWWLWVKEGRAPKGIRLGSRTTVWRAEDIRSLLDQLSQEH